MSTQEAITAVDWKVVWRGGNDEVDITVWEREVNGRSRWDVEVMAYGRDSKTDGLFGHFECQTFAEILAALRDAEVLRRWSNA